MRVLRIVPANVERDGRTIVGSIDIVYKLSPLLFWRNKERTRRAVSATGILWKWLDSPNTYLHEASEMIRSNVDSLLAGETVDIQNLSDQGTRR